MKSFLLNVVISTVAVTIIMIFLSPPIYNYMHLMIVYSIGAIVGCLMTNVDRLIK